MGIPVRAVVPVGMGSAVDSERAEVDFALLTRRLIANPANLLVQKAVLTAIHASRFAHLTEATSEKVYRIALYALAENSVPAMRNFALEVGRWHFGRFRPDKQPMVCEEQAIQKDVFARSSWPES